MVRHRKVVNVQHKHVSNAETSSSSGNSETSVASQTFKVLSLWKTLIGFLCFVIAVYVGILGYLETRVNTPFDDEKGIAIYRSNWSNPTGETAPPYRRPQPNNNHFCAVVFLRVSKVSRSPGGCYISSRGQAFKVVKETGLAVPDRYWGSYRSGVYFGMKSREPRSPIFGLMWYYPNAMALGVRHWCEQSDNLATYAWNRHDGVTFGEQLISDPPHIVQTSFVKTPGGEHGGQWTARINVTLMNNRPTEFMLVWYGALDESLGPAAPDSRLWVEGGALLGHTPQLGNFRVNLVPQRGRIIKMSYSEAHAPGLNLLKEKFYSLLKTQKDHKFKNLPMVGPDDELNGKDKEVNFVPIQMLVETPFSLDVVYTTEDAPSPPLQGSDYAVALEEKKKAFDVEFEKKFGLLEKGYLEEDVAIAKTAMSNMIGSIGYFYGAGRVISQYTREPVPYWRAPLYTGVPSRSFFPRGFLWDEGFHAMLIGRWNLDIQMDIAAHWMDLINVEGWIPREQILGPEALARVPKEFVVQNNAVANPPILLIQLARFVKSRPLMFEPGSQHRRTLDRMFTRLQAWYQWFQNTQKGEKPTSYRWRDREDDGIQLNSKTMSSGMDDYPRASHPSEIERHVDLRCWMYAAADALATIARLVNRDPSKFEATRDQLGDEDLLNELHWSPATQTYVDYGLHTDGVRLVRKPPRHPGEQGKMVRSVTSAPQPQFVNSIFGYNSLFPMLLKVLKPDSFNLGKILESLDKPNLLWSPYGLRSLSKSSPLYMKRNTEHDPPYWRGQVWININYLALAALKHYSAAPGPYMERARELHSRLKENVVRNILSEYKRTGTFWEQYSSEDGSGSGSRPFTGWTGLFVLIMAEEY